MTMQFKSHFYDNHTITQMKLACFFHDLENGNVHAAGPWLSCISNSFFQPLQFMHRNSYELATLYLVSTAAIKLIITTNYLSFKF